MSSWISYKGYYAKPEYSAEDGILFGKIEYIADLVTFEAENAADIEQEFHDAVDDYLQTCEELGKEPEKAYKGSFNVRISPTLHRELAIYARQHDYSLNEAVGKAISNLLHPLQTSFICPASAQLPPVSAGMDRYWDRSQKTANWNRPIKLSLGDRKLPG